MRSYLRYYCEAFRLPDRTPDEIAGAGARRGRRPGARRARGRPPGRRASSATSATGTSPAPGAPPHLGPVVDRRRAAQARGGVRRVPRLPGVARHDDPPAHRRWRRLRRSCAATSREPVLIVALLADRDLTDRGVEVDLCGHRARMAAGPAALALATGAAAAPGVDPLRAASSGRSWKHRIVITFHDRVAGARERHDPRQGGGDDPGRAPTRSAPRSSSTPPTGTCCSGSSSTTSTRDRRAREPGRAAGTLAVRIGIVCPYSFDVPGGCSSTSATWPSTSSARATTVACSRPPTTTPRCPTTSTSVGRAVPVRYNGSVARLNFGPLTAARVGRWLEARRLRRPPHPRAGHPERRRCWRCGRPRGRSSRPSTPPTCARARCRRPTRCCGPAWRRSTAGSPSPRTPGAPSRPTSAATRSSSPTASTSHRFADAVPAARVAGHRRTRRPSPSSAGSTSRARACRCWPRRMPAVLAQHPGAAGPRRRPGRRRRAARERLDPSRGRGHASSSAWSATRTRPRCCVGRPLRRAAHRRRELRHRAGRGDERGRPGPRQRPAGVRRGSSTAGRPGATFANEDSADLARHLLAPARRPRRARAAWASSGTERAWVFDWSVVADGRHGGLRDGHRRRRRGPAEPPTTPRVDPAAARPPDGGE